jgi:hypothetical protein
VVSGKTVCLVAAALGALGAVGGAAVAADDAPPPALAITVYKSPTCGCCKKWIEHLQAAGFRVTAHDTSDLAGVREHYGVPRKLTACHTAVVEGYVVEGHVPADVIERLLKEHPAIAGVAVPGMPAGSPGMESMESAPRARYLILTFEQGGKTAVYGSR